MKKQQRWARDVLNGEYGEFVVLDLETTGLTSYDEPCQIGIVGSSGEALFDSLIKPTIPIGAGAEAIHGISNEAVEHAPSIAQVYDQLYAILVGKTVLVYNVPFDSDKMRRACRVHELEYLTGLGSWHCVMEQYAAFHGELRWNGGYKWQSLTNACRQQGIPVQDAHSALGDALMTLELLKAMAGVREGVK